MLFGERQVLLEFWTAVLNSLLGLDILEYFTIVYPQMFLSHCPVATKTKKQKKLPAKSPCRQFLRIAIRLFNMLQA